MLKFLNGSFLLSSAMNMVTQITLFRKNGGGRLVLHSFFFFFCKYFFNGFYGSLDLDILI